MGLRFDVIVMQEVYAGVGEGGGVGETRAEQVGALQEVMGDTVAFFKDYLAKYVDLLEKGGLDTFVLESFALREADRAYLAETYEVVLVLDSLDEVGLTQEDVGAVVAEGGLLYRHPWVEAHCSVVVTVRGEYLKGVDTSPSGVWGWCACCVHAAVHRGGCENVHRACKHSLGEGTQRGCGVAGDLRQGRVHSLRA